MLTGNCQECSLQSGVVRKNRFKAGILGILTGLEIKLIIDNSYKKICFRF